MSSSMTVDTAEISLRELFRRHAAGVAIVTTSRADGSPAGVTISSLASLSADPPLATFNLARTASSWPAFESAERVMVNLLGRRNRDLAARFAGRSDARFAGDHWAPGPHGLPLLRDVPAHVCCRVVSRVPVARSAVIVVELEVARLGTHDDGLLYRDGAYRATVDEL